MRISHYLHIVLYDTIAIAPLYTATLFMRMRLIFGKDMSWTYIQVMQWVINACLIDV
jgi:hypothetical protein